MEVTDVDDIFKGITDRCYYYDSPLGFICLVAICHYIEKQKIYSNEYYDIFSNMPTFSKDIIYATLLECIVEFIK